MGTKTVIVALVLVVCAAWARTLASSLPRTTAYMLALDHLHRAKSSLDPVLRGKLRWVSADINCCSYAKRYAEFDLKRAGVSVESIKALAGDLKALPKEERSAIAFARKLSQAAHTVTDEEMAELILLFGEEKVVAMVHTLAHANFQDRIFLALDVQVEEGGPFPPLEIRIAPPDSTKSAAPRRPPWKVVHKVKVAIESGALDWRPLEVAEVYKALEQQKNRKARIKSPPADRLAKFPPKVRRRIKKIGWSTVSVGYEPRLTMAWFDCMGNFSQEARLNPVFSSSLFQVVTLSLSCFY
jgi:alkylhydroperoxidase family enzyme